VVNPRSSASSAVKVGACLSFVTLVPFGGYSKGVTPWLTSANGSLCFLHMKNITLKAIPADLQAQLESEAESNFRSVEQEVLARVQRSFDLDDRLTTTQVNKLIQQSMDSGSEYPLTDTMLDSAFDAACKKHRSRKAA
jgi:hypothetical protein